MSRSLFVQGSRFVYTAAQRRRKSIIKYVTYYVLLCLGFFLLLGHLFPTSTIPAGLYNSRHALLIVAHPDDESLFFNPTILGLTQRRANNDATMGLVVVSSGNNYGLGKVRKAEIKAACSTLGIDKSQCEVLDIPSLQDNPHKWWDRDALKGIVTDYVKKWKIDTILTFDYGGVSGHINHRAVSDAAAHYSLNTQNAPPTYVLSTTTVFRKYTILGDLPFTFLKYILTRSCTSKGAERGLLVNSFGLYVQGINAFRNHASQFVWDRYLYVVLSRYMWFNDVRAADERDIRFMPD